MLYAEGDDPPRAILDQRHFGAPLGYRRRPRVEHDIEELEELVCHAERGEAGAAPYVTSSYSLFPESGTILLGRV